MSSKRAKRKRKNSRASGRSSKKEQAGAHETQEHHPATAKRFAGMSITNLIGSVFAFQLLAAYFGTTARLSAEYGELIAFGGITLVALVVRLLISLATAWIDTAIGRMTSRAKSEDADANRIRRGRLSWYVGISVLALIFGPELVRTWNEVREEANWQRAYAAKSQL